ncbi:D-alanyl-D-alanine carboxypeptidase, partial [Streptomyces sp. NPDC051913]|uniref:D-alanyl-D-alanine carboxypeptidase n=1 Tax=Streptomyces sp. NPDC051913 TaxID=3365676 RepID=UPI0037D7F135
GPDAEPADSPAGKPVLTGTDPSDEPRDAGPDAEPADSPAGKPVLTGTDPSDEPRDAGPDTEPADSPARKPVATGTAAEPTDEPRDARGGTEPADGPVTAAKADEPADKPVSPASTGAADKAREPADKPTSAAPKPDPRAASGTAAPAPADAPRSAEGDKAPQDSPAPGAASRAPAPADAPQAAGGDKSPQDSPPPGTASRAATPADAPPAAPGGKAPRSDVPAAADGGKAPQGPPAGGDESRTGGAGGKKTEAEAGRQVDQPTTMLKLPPSAERTSKFVALKPDVTTPVPQVGPERTTQQPLPPKPPLDLLAELTNTPPPPETPLRTTVRRVKIWTPLVLLLAVIFAVVQSVRALPTPTLQLTAEDSYSFDGGKVDIPWPTDGQGALDVQGIGSFGSSGDQKPVPIASVAKVMTAYLVLRDHPLKSGAKGPNIKIDQTAQDEGAAKSDESKVAVTAGDAISQREALESILIASANNIARLLARWDAGSEKAFVEKMNDAADDLGMTNTTYTDPSGLNNTTVSTAVDQVKLAKKAMEYPAFREVAAMMSYDDYKGENHPNWNQLVGKNDVVGIKTGTTTSALGNLVFAAKKEVDGETRTIVGAVLRQPAGGVDNTILSAALTAGDQLIRAAQGALESATIIKKGDVVGYVDDGLGGHTPVVATKDVTAVGWSGLTVKLTFAADDVPHTAKAGTKVGTLTVGDSSAGAVAVPVALQKDLVEPGFTDKLTRLG